MTARDAAGAGGVPSRPLTPFAALNPTVDDPEAAATELRSIARNILFDYEDGEPVPEAKYRRLAKLCVAFKIGDRAAAPTAAVEPGTTPA